MGPVETATRTLVEGMGVLSAWQSVTAEQAYRVAGLLDEEGGGAQASALSRELRLLVEHMLPSTQAATGEPAAGGDAVAKVQDQLAAKRSERRQR